MTVGESVRWPLKSGNPKIIAFKQERQQGAEVKSRKGKTPSQASPGGLAKISDSRMLTGPERHLLLRIPASIWGLEHLGWPFGACGGGVHWPVPPWRRF
jgi:hypothetical protein